jgi:two-component system CheB/CheR fusion protein
MNQERPEDNKQTKQNQDRQAHEGGPNQQPKPAEASSKNVPVIGLGASAGGLDALKAFFAEVPENSGLAYIVLMHLSPDQPSMLPEILQKVTTLPVTKAEDGQSIEPDYIYAVPAKKEISVYKGTIQLLEPTEKKISMPIDYFFRSLASDKKSNAAAVILSGTGSDGTVGLREIKDHEGLVLAQSKDTAKYDGMPASAINTGLVDMILAPQDMPQKLSNYFDNRQRVTVKKKEISEDQEWLNKIFALLRVQAGQDFSFYKTNTIHRRINRRMVLNQIDSKDTYLSFLRENPNEVQALFRELLIGVTNFFRDPEAFEALKNDILPKVFTGLKNDTAFRVWVPGCSSGEEVFSLAMIILECLDQFPGKKIDLQIFGSDIDQRAIDKARQGLYPSSIQADVSQERLSRFFHLEGEAYRIRKEVRDSVVFSVQNVLKDPPFSRLNLLSCRNLLIYLNDQAQKMLLPIFHYTLVPGGIMMLGTSETIGGFTNLFEGLDNTLKIYERREVPQALLPRIEFPAGKPDQAAQADAAPEQEQRPKADLDQETRKLILEHFAPSAVLIDSKGNILNIQGRTGKYLEPASGPPNQNILDMAREGLRTELHLAMRKAVNTQEEIVRRQVQVKVNGGIQAVDLYVCPVTKPKALSGRLLVAFEDVEASQPHEKPQGGKEMEAPESEYERRIQELEQELQDTRENHQTTVEELESSNEELKSTNEELQSSNEELQSTNEELESSKEELQSLNEELQTVNSELQSKVDELSDAYDDINNLLSSTQIATIFVDNDLQVKRFSKEAEKIVNLIESDVGRPLEHQSTHLQDVDLTTGIKQVLDNLTPVEKEVQTQDGNWYIMRIMPYRTRDNRIQGAVVTFRDVDEQKKSQEKLRELNNELEQAWFLVRSVFDMNQKPLAVLDDHGQVVIANTALCRQLDLSMQEIEGLDIVNLDKADLWSSDLQAKLGKALEADEDFETEPFQVDTEQGKKTMIIRGQVVRQGKKDRPYRILLQFVKG